MKILIVDDDYEKVRLIGEQLRRADLAADLVQETTASAARRRLQRDHYDLLLIDLNLPEVPGAAPNGEGGLALFDMLLADPNANLPGEILFITAEENLMDAARSKVEERGASLCPFSSGSGGWPQIIIGRARLAARRATAPNQIRADVVINTALHDPEIVAVLNLPYQWTDLRLKDDPTRYFEGRLAVGDREIKIVAASALNKGMASSAALATKMAVKFRPTLLMMTGICAGVKSRCSLGDVVVGDPTWDWGSGKHAEDDSGSPVFRMSPVQRRLNTSLADVCAELGNSEEVRSRITAGWKGKHPEGKFKCHVGAMASGASVVADRSTAKIIAEQNRDLIAIEMEAYAVMAACEFAFAPPAKGVAVKSVCDYADPEKGDDWQPYAAYTSAAFAHELIQHLYGTAAHF